MIARKTMLAIAPFLWPLGEDKGVRTVFETLSGYVRGGYEVHLITLSSNPEEVSEYRGIHVHSFRLGMVPPGVEYGLFRSIFSYPLGLMRFPGLSFIADKLLWAQFLFQARRLAMKVAREIKPQLVYGISSYGIPVAWMIGRRLRVPNVSRLLGTFLYPWLLSPPSLLGRLKLRFRLLMAVTETLAFKVPSVLTIITNDGTRGAWVAEQLGVPAQRVRCWVNGFVRYPAASATAIETLAKLGIEPGDKVVLSVCQLVAWKRVDRLIEAFALAQKEVPEGRLLILGDGKERPALERHAALHTKPGTVLFAGAVPHSEVIQCLAAADIYASAHDLTNACNTLFEAMRAGAAIVTIRNGDTDTFIEHGVNGMLVDEPSVSSFAATLASVLREADTRRRIRERARQSALELFVSWEERMQREVREVESLSGQGFVPEEARSRESAAARVESQS